MLTFFDAEDYKGTASIYETHITFNKPLLKYLSEAYRVRVGADKEEGCAYIYLYTKDKAFNGEIKPSTLLPVSINKTYARICSKILCDYISRIFGLDIPHKSFLRFMAKYDDVKNCIVIDLKEAI